MRVAWTRRAFRHLDEIQEYIAGDRPTAAFEVVKNLTERTTATLGTSPMAGRPGRVKHTRELVFADLPYIVVYRVAEHVEVVGVLHVARKWPRRFE
ncbi:hypothetical protein ASD83_07235 [Devosia sp. Root685]|uniref:type II toxin-antitoxin system RelE/ParE family toxin n=1 Tax=Devosia sp. Root685 TaxID=1736587 RepID=UPI0006F1F0CE|nr:type II toxin-antitoxin system RelE/ParE family toxin [Devosia sp. Root685]KRB01297.1 hypothetical protein ASD83_07235 [Devosia sp. Root685]